jgi:hypothetical protein
MDTAPNALERLFDQIRALDESCQAHIAEVLTDQVKQARQKAEHEGDMQDPEYRAYVENALREGEADYQAGQMHSADDVSRALEKAIKSKYDALRD